MLPILEIQQSHDGLYTYSVRAARQDAHPSNDFFDSVARCLQEAGSILNLYFEGVQISIAGVPLGIHRVTRLVQDPGGVFDELMGRLRISDWRQAPLSRGSTGGGRRLPQFAGAAGR